MPTASPIISARLCAVEEIETVPVSDSAPKMAVATPKSAVDDGDSGGQQGAEGQSEDDQGDADADDVGFGGTPTGRCRRRRSRRCRPACPAGSLRPRRT